jgi:flagellar biosynthesis chaperone FliJ
MSAQQQRGYAYPLEPLRRIRSWELEMALADVARVRAAIASWEQTRAAIASELETAASLARDGWAARTDPRTRRAQIDFLAAMQRRRAHAVEEIERLGHALQDALKAAEERRVALEMLDRHRGEDHVAWRHEGGRREQRQADEDWTLSASNACAQEKTP